MDVDFETSDLPAADQAEIEDVLKRIAVGEQPGRWRQAPEAIRVRRRLTGGRGACQVLEITTRSGRREAFKVVKIGPIRELKNEWGAFNKYLSERSSRFAPIEAATPGVLDAGCATDGELEAVVYDHASRFVGLPDEPPETLETVVRRGVREGGSALDRAVRAVDKLFAGIRSDLYHRYDVLDAETTLLEAWNLRLGIAATIEVDAFDPATATLVHGPAADARRIYPRDVMNAALRLDVGCRPGDPVELRGLRADWWDERLLGELVKDFLRIEVITRGRRSIRDLAPGVADGDTFHVRGTIRTLRTRDHRRRLLEGLPELAAADGELRGDGARLPDPFASLPAVLEGRRADRITAVVHGDLNPRNALVVDDTPCLIDYAFLGAGEPILMDFARLEGCLVRDALPADLSWAAHVRLQRLLAAACRLDDRAADLFVRRLGEDRRELAAAFRVLWAVRRAAREAYPDACRGQWARDYLEQLFLFAHLTLKWDDQPAAALRASAATASAATEALAATEVYRRWSPEDLRGDGVEILRLVEPGRAGRELAAMARALDPLGLPADDPREAELERVRASHVRAAFQDEANAILVALKEDHDVYISLRAYISLKARLGAASPRQRRSFEEMLRDDRLLAESEGRRREETEDVLRLLAAQGELVMIGDAGGGKTTVAREWQYQLAGAIAEAGGKVPRLPVVERAPDLWSRLASWVPEDPRSSAAVLDRDPDLLAAGLVHLTVDALNELPEDPKQKVADWLTALRQAYPRTPVVACHRQYNYVAGLLPFPVVRLEKVENDQARRYVFDYLRARDVPDHRALAQRLVRLLLDDPEHAQVRDLAQTPLFLWMIVERYRRTQKPPAGRGELFRDFSHWYLEERHHTEHGEAVAHRFAWEEKAALLGAVGYELVQRLATDLPAAEVERLVPAELRDRRRELVDEIVAAEMLLRSGDKLRFLHQSFQEYFAARHFLVHEARDEDAIGEKVRRFGWHDTFAVLLGFAEDRPEVVTQVIEAALESDPMLTARCLRMAEQRDHLLERFVAGQEAILRNPAVGTYYHERAAQALAEHGRGQARTGLLRVAADPLAPVDSRVAVLGLLAKMPAQARFEPVAEKILRELKDLLVEIFGAAAPAEVHQAAIAAAVTARLSGLAAYLVERVQEGEWTLRRAAWEACGSLGVERPPKLRAAYVEACEERLARTEEKLYQEVVMARMAALNRERVAILAQLAAPKYLPLLLNRRFGYRIQDDVAKIVDRTSDAEGEPREEAREAWSVLREESTDEATVDRWWRLLRQGDDLTAAAAAHRLAAFGKELDAARVEGLLDASLPPGRLAVVASLAATSENAGLAEPLAELVRGLVEKIEGPAVTEAFTNMAAAVTTLDSHRGNRLAAVARMIFVTRRSQAVLPGQYPWRRLSAWISLDKSDHEVLLSAGGDDARAAVDRLQAVGGATLRVAKRDYSPTKLDDPGRKRFCELAAAEEDPAWQVHYACAAVKVQATDLLPWLLKWSENPELVKSQVKIWHTEFGKIIERQLADVLRAIGYLARLLIDDDQADEAAGAVAMLHERAAGLATESDRSMVAGITTAVGYLGEWEPTLTWLGPGEPWMHEAAANIFTHSVAKPPGGIPERERAARWIVRRLGGELAPEVRSTLGRLLDGLEREIGYRVAGLGAERS